MVEWLAWLCRVDDGLVESSSSVSSLSNGPSSALGPENDYFTHILLRKLPDIQVGFNLIHSLRCLVVLFTSHFPIAVFRVAGRTPTPTPPITTTNKRHGQTWGMFSQFQRGMRDVYMELLLGVTRRCTEAVFGPPVPACKDREVRRDLCYNIYGYSQTRHRFIMFPCENMGSMYV